MSVLPAYRRHGIGKRLLNEAVKDAKNYIDTSASAISGGITGTLELSVMTELIEAVALYKSQGFCEVGKQVACGSCHIQRMVLGLG